MKTQFSPWTPRALLTALMFIGLASEAPAAFGQVATPPPAAADCPGAASGLPLTVFSGAKLLPSGAALFMHDDSAKTVVVHIPGNTAADLTSVATAVNAGDSVRSAVSADGTGVDVTWTIADPTSPLAQIALKAAGAPATLRALNVRGLAACVRRQAAGDVVDLKLPGNLGTLHLALSADASQLIASTDASDRLAMKGTIALPSLVAQIDVSGRFDPNDANRLTALGKFKITSDGLALESGTDVKDVIDAAGLPIHLQAFQLALSRLNAGTASITFTPALSSSLPFTIGALTANVDGNGRLSLGCSSAAPIAFTSSSLAIGSGSFKALTLAVDPTATSQLTCDGTRYSGFETVIALSWDNVLTGQPLKFRLAGSAAGVSITPLTGATFPDIKVGLDPLGLQFRVDAPQLSVDPAGLRNELQIKGQVSVAFASAGIATNPLPLAVALRSTGGTLSGVATCASSDVKKSHADPQGPFLLPLSLNCANGEIAGIASEGGPVVLPLKAGGIHATIPSFSFSFADRSLTPADLSVPFTATAGGSVLDFPGGHVDELKLGYTTAAGFQFVATASVTLPTGQNVAEVLKIHDIAIGKRNAGLGLIGIGHIEAPPKFSIAGMQLETLTDTDVCKAAKSPVDVLFDDKTERVNVKLCGRASLLPAFLSPKQTQSHVGDLASGSGVIPPGDAKASLSFRGLVLGPDGSPVADPSSPDSFVCDGDTQPSNTLSPTELHLLKAEQREVLDCRVSAQIEDNIALGPLELRQINVNLIRKLTDGTVPTRPQFRILALVKFGKYLSTDGATSGVINAQFNNQRMVVAGRFDDVVSVRFGVVSAGIRGFTMDFSDQRRSFVAEGGQVSTGGPAGVSTTTLYFSEIAFVEVKDKSGNFKVSKLSAPVDVKRTGLGLLFRLVTDLGSTSFLHLFKLP